MLWLGLRLLFFSAAVKTAAKNAPGTTQQQ
jgi:hypothetical protein